MKLYHWQSPHGNVGDDLNTWLWPKVFGEGVFDTTMPRFFGIGSILDARVEDGTKPGQRNIVFGAGLRKSSGYCPARTKVDIRFVRGPVSVAALARAGLPGLRFISDPAILTPRFAERPSHPVRGRIGFIPYYSTPPAITAHIARDTGMEIVPITTTVEDFLTRLTACEYIVTEAMHGAILADAFRIPWAACRLFSGINEGRTSLFKWHDWSTSLGMTYPHPSALPEPLLWLPRRLRLPLEGLVARRSPDVVEKVLARADWTLSNDARLRQAQDDILEEAAQLSVEYGIPCLSQPTTE